MKVSKLKEILYFFLLFFFFRASLDVSYVEFIAPIYTKSFLSLAFNFDLWRYLSSWILYFIPLAFLNHRLKSVSDYFFVLYCLTILAPILSIYGLNYEKGVKPVLLSFLAYFFILIVVKSSYFKVPKLPLFKNSRMLIIWVATSSVLYLVLWSVASGAASNVNFDPTKVYDFREQNSKVLDSGFLAYLNLWVYKFFNIFLFVYFLSKKSYGKAFLIFLLQVYFYGITAHKMVFFLPILAAGVWYYFSKTKKLIVLPALYSVLVCLALLIYVLFDSELIPSMLIRRAFYVPAGLAFEWVEFFDSNPKVYWTDSLLAFTGLYPYSTTIPKTVGEFLLGPELAANNGLVSAGYAHAGIGGVVAYAVILGYVIKLLDNVTKVGVPVWLSIALTIGPLRTAITDSDLLTVLISHGLLIALFILILFRSRERE